MSPHLVPKLHHTALVGFDLRQMERDVLVELLEEGDPIANQNRQDRIANLVGQPETKALTADDAPSGEPDAAEPGPQAPIHELREIAGVELDGVPGPRQLTMSENEGRLVAVHPPEPPGLKSQRGLIGA